MADNTKIEWTDATANYCNGCSVLSNGCKRCYAMRLAGTRMKNHPSRVGLTIPTKVGPVWTGEVRANNKALTEVLGWKRPRRIFWNAHGDLFHENVPDAWIDRQWAVMALKWQHKHQVLTKRPNRMEAYLADSATPARIMAALVDVLPGSSQIVANSRDAARWRIEDDWHLGLENVWLGTSVEDQAAADARIPHLLATPAATRFLSCEPLLGPVDIRWTDVTVPGLDWIIVGGESGPGARPMHAGWARSLHDQCAESGVPFFFKQHGDWIDASQLGWLNPMMDIKNCDQQDGFVKVGKKAAGRLLDGIEHNGMPA